MVLARTMLVLGLGGLGALLVGLWALPPQLAFDFAATANAIFGQFPNTLPAAIVVLVVAAANIATAGFVVSRALPVVTRSPSSFVLAAYSSAVLLDVTCLYVLGGFGLFTPPMLVLVHAGLLAIAVVIRRPTLSSLRLPDLSGHRPHLGWALVGIVWSAPILLQLASPVVPFMDVLPNLVAPVEHVRTFAHFDPLTTSPSPIYGPSRLSLGYVGLLGTVATLSGLPAAQAASAFILVEAVLVAVGVASLARASAGRHAVYWSLVAFAMTQPFARLTDDRSRILAIPIVAWTVLELLRVSRRREAQQTAWTIGIGLGATLVLHAVMGAFLALVLLVQVALRPPLRRAVTPALVMAGILALPQAMIVLGIDVPSLAAAIAVPLAFLGAATVDRMPVIRAVLAQSARVAVALGIGATAVGAVWVVPALVRWGSDFGPAVPFLSLTGVTGLIWLRPSARSVLISMLAVGVLAGTLANIPPPGTDNLLLEAVSYEVPKEVHTWLPIVLAISSAALLAQIVRGILSTASYRQGWRVGLVGAWLVVAALPLRAEPIDPLHVGERHLSENVAIQLRYAQNGFWSGYPDARWLVDDKQRLVLAAIRREIAEGRISPTTRLLHIARTYQQWGAIPIGVFTGVLETDVSPDSRVTIHTVGGRLVPMDRLRAELAGDYDYLLVEWRDLPPEIAQLIGGFEPIFTTEEAQLLRRRE